MQTKLRAKMGLSHFTDSLWAIFRAQSRVSVLTKDGHTQWVMDILPYPIQMYWVIPGSSWVEPKRVGYGYYSNSSGRVWILSIPDPYIL